MRGTITGRRTITGQFLHHIIPKGSLVFETQKKVFSLKSVAKWLPSRVGTLSAEIAFASVIASNFNWRISMQTIARALVTRPKLLILDEPTEGIQPSIIKDIGRVLSLLKGRGDMAILLVEQYLDFALGLGDRLCVLDRGRVKLSGTVDEISSETVRDLVTV